MAKRIFVSFAIEDLTIKHLFVGQARNKNVPYELVDMSAKQPWDTAWKTQCRSRIKGCDGVIVLITKNLKNAEGALWEINCAKEEGIPILGVYMESANFFFFPSELSGQKRVEWKWSLVAEFIENL